MSLFGDIMSIKRGSEISALELKLDALRIKYVAEHEACNIANRKVESLEKRVVELDAINKLACEDWAEDDTAIRNLCRPFLTETTCDHDGYAVVPIQDAVKNALESLKSQCAAMREALASSNEHQNSGS